MSGRFKFRMACIGAGNMAEALIKGWLQNRIMDAEDVIIADASADRRRYIKETYGIASAIDNADAVTRASVVLLAVKPQVMADVLREISAHADPDQLFISIAAGIPAAAIEKELAGGIAVVRVMPNTPALVGRGMSAISGGTYAGDAQLGEAEKLLKAVGRVIRVEESAMDAVTAVSGSGPAYLFHFIECLADAAEEAGLPADIAKELALRTVEGAALLAAGSGDDPSVLREKVTSKGGTTEAALRILGGEHGLRELLTHAVIAARDRSRALSGGTQG